MGRFPDRAVTVLYLVIMAALIVGAHFVTG